MGRKRTIPALNAPQRNSVRIPPVWYTLEDARQKVEEALRGFLEGDLDAEDQYGYRRALALRVTVGVGKSATLRKLLSEVARDILANGHILVFVPTHALAEEAEGAFRELRSGIPSMVLRGREAKIPGADEFMCDKAALASRISQVTGRVSRALCQAQDPLTGELFRAPCRTGCAWYDQFADSDHKVIFLPHAYLVSPIHPSIAENVALRIIDEKFANAITWAQTIHVDGWLTPCGCASNGGATSPCIHIARRIVHGALLSGEPIFPALSSAGLVRGQMETFEAIERAEQPVLDVVPWMETADQEAAVDTFDYAAFFRSRARARLWSMLHEDWPRGASDRISLGSDGNAADGLPPRAVIRLHSCGTIYRDAPLILLDADADPLVTEALVPGAEFVSIDVKPNADVIQVEDRTFSTASLLMRPGAEMRRAEILDVVRREVAAAPHGVLLVATKDVLRQLHRDVNPQVDLTSEEALLQPLLGAHPRWFGPRMQGVNTYEDFDTAIAVGRLQPRIEAIEDDMRALFGNSGAPLTFTDPADPTRGWFMPTASEYLLADGTVRAATIRSHPDPRGAGVLSLCREASTIQALGRIRAVKPGAPKRILILSSLVLPDFPVDRLVLWQELVTGLSRLELGAKSQRLEAALYPYGGAWSVSAIRLSAAGIQEDAPEVFDHPHSAKEWRRGLTTGAIQEMIRTIARRRGGRPTFVMLQRARGGKITPAVLFDCGDNRAEIVGHRWPELELSQHTFR